MCDFPLRLLREFPKFITGSPRGAPTNSVLQTMLKEQPLSQLRWQLSYEESRAARWDGPYITIRIANYSSTLFFSHLLLPLAWVSSIRKIHFPLAFHCEKMYYIDMEIVKFRTQVLHFSVTPKELRKRRLRQKSLIYYIILYSVPHQKGWFF